MGGLREERFGVSEEREQGIRRSGDGGSEEREQGIRRSGDGVSEEQEQGIRRSGDGSEIGPVTKKDKNKKIYDWYRCQPPPGQTVEQQLSVRTIFHRDVWQRPS